MADKKDDIVARIRRLGDLESEAMLCATILNYARSGHATPLMIEQAIALVQKHIDYAAETNKRDETAERLKAGLEEALAEGVASLRVKRGPGPEVTEVEEPIAKARIAAGHDIRRQHKCGGGIVDIYDLTADELIECKHQGTSAALGEAAGQLNRYRKSFPGAALTIAVVGIEPEAEWLADLLRAQGISIIELGRGQ